MLKKIAISTVVSLAALLGLAFAQGAVAPMQPLLVTEVNKPFGTVVETFRNEVRAAGWTILNTTNMAGVLSGLGHTVHPVLIFDLCSGRYAAQILSRDEFRFISAFMPCRVSIYQTSDGRTFISRMNTRAFAPMMPRELAEVLVQSSNEIEAVIARVGR
jgi:uncharacterized protein (DUF302 family)